MLISLPASGGDSEQAARAQAITAINAHVRRMLAMAHELVPPGVPAGDAREAADLDDPAYSGQDGCDREGKDATDGHRSASARVAVNFARGEST
ncbi:hypothetical protein [Sorangium sp. So ce341]|uniref:hypothetical protein n=1 Tax=Sorangium sp. So ce341 TaxID=3133302 RepID=UPI003F5EB315